MIEQEQIKSTSRTRAIGQSEKLRAKKYPTVFVGYLVRLFINSSD